jgi:hypothetical protein
MGTASAGNPSTFRFSVNFDVEVHLVGHGGVLSQGKKPTPKPWTGVKLQTSKPYSKLRIQAETNLGCGGKDGQSDNGGDEDSAHGNVVQFE